jgi:putative tryptophan/tyrosine transport system substrate-binding protein
MIHASALAALILLVAMAVRSDASAPSALPRIVFLGWATPRKDPSFDRFMAVVARNQPALASRVRFEQVALPDNDAQALDEALQRTVATRPALLIAPNGTTAIAARRLAGATPLVFSSYLDPLRYGIVTALLRRDEAVAGLWMVDQLDGKRLELLHDAYPGIRSVAVLGDPSWDDSVGASLALPPLAARLGLSITILHAENEAQARAILADRKARDFDAWCVPRSYLAVVASSAIREQLLTFGKPMIFATTGDVIAGAPMAYAIDTSFAWPALAELVARIVDGEPAGSIPIERPTKFVLAIRTGAQTNLPPPHISVVRRADVVIR